MDKSELMNVVNKGDYTFIRI